VKAEGRKNIANGHHPEVQSLPEEKEEEDAEIPATHLKKEDQSRAVRVGHELPARSVVVTD
jgi:hypothetical protein